MSQDIDIIEAEFYSVAVTHLKIVMYHPSDAIRVVQRCKELNRRILGLDAFTVNEPYIQPSLEDSVDFSTSQSKDGFWAEAEEFLRRYLNSAFVFEVVYE